MRYKGMEGSSPQEAFPALQCTVKPHSLCLHSNPPLPHGLGGFPVPSCNASPSTLIPKRHNVFTFLVAGTVKIIISSIQGAPHSFPS